MLFLLGLGLQLRFEAAMDDDIVLEERAEVVEVHEYEEETDEVVQQDPLGLHDLVEPDMQ